MEPTDWDSAEDATLKALPRTIESAQGGNPENKRRLLEIFCAQVDAGKTPYPELLRYISAAFAQALAEKESAKVLAKLLLGGPRNRPHLPERDERDEALAIEVSELLGRGMAQKDCFRDLAETSGFAEDVIEHAWRKFRNSPLLKDPFKS